MSLRWRLTAVIGSVVALMLFTASFLAYVSADRELNRQANDFLLNRSRETEQGLDFADALPIDLSEEALGVQRGALGALTRADASIQILFREAERALVISEPSITITAEDVEIANLPPQEEILRTTFDREVDGVRHRVLVSSNSRGALMVGRSMGDISQTLTGLRGWLVLISISGSLAAGLVGWVVADRVLRPVARLAAATEQVAETRRFDADLRVEGTDELGALARSFNSMLSTLRASREQQERLVRDANHELRTPLTTLRTNVDVMRRRGNQLDDEQRDGIVEEMDSEVRELTELVTELVGFATNSATLAPEAFVELDLVTLGQEAANRTIRRTGRRIDMSGVSEAPVLGDPTGLERAIGNLIGNAVKFSQADTEIMIVVGAESIEVHDRGPGISTEDLPRIFDRFYRADATRTMPGSGLGLAIVSDIAHAHGGETFARQRDGGGSIIGFTVTADLPSLSA